MEDWVISHVCITPILGTIKTELKRLHLKSGNLREPTTKRKGERCANM